MASANYNIVMPTYSYYCKKCDRNFEELRSYEEREKKLSCVHCGKRQCPYTVDLSKSDNQSGVIFKGGGTPKFYHTGESRAKSEHRWMENQIDATKEALQFKKGASPYTKRTLDNEALEKAGIAKRVTGEEKKARKKTAHKRNLVAAEAASKEMTKLDIEHISGQQGNEDKPTN